MKIKIYPIVSSLHAKNVINEETSNLLAEIKTKLDCEIEITDIDALYEGDLALILVQSGGSEGAFLKNIAKFKAPFYLLTYGSNNSLAASLEILSYLRDQNAPAEVLHGSSDYIVKRIRELTKRSNLAPKRFGVLGKPSDWLIASNVDYQVALKRLNVELVDIPISKVLSEYEKAEVVEVKYKLDFPQKEVASALKLYGALKNIKKEYKLDGLTIRCFDLLDTLKTTACLGLALFNSENTVATCEGDIPTMMSMHLLNELFKAPGFQANPSKIDVEKKTIILAHCTLPFNMPETYTLDTHYESGLGVAIRGVLKPGKVTIFKFAKNLKDYYVTTGTITKSLAYDNLCRTQIEVKIDENIEYFLTRPYGNHHVIIYGDHKKEIINFLQNLE